jgi:basic amino acid/polyamine antiporter, APA family
MVCLRRSSATLPLSFSAVHEVAERSESFREEALPNEMPRSESISSGSMLRILGVTFGVAVSLGSSIGSGIMRTPSQIASRMPSEWLILSAWMMGALYSLLGAWSLAEVGAMIPSSGAYYTIARRAFGDYIGFVVGWNDWVSNCSAVAAAGILVGEYSRDILPRLDHPLGTAAGVMMLIAALQWRGVRWGSRFQNITSALTAMIFLVLILGSFLGHHGRPAAASGLPLPSRLPLLVAYILTLQAVIYTFDGWYSSIYFGDELVDPGRQMPRSMLHSVVLLSAIFLLTNVALFHVLGVAGIAKEDLPVAALGRSIFGPVGEVVVRALMIVALLALINSVILAATRVLYGMSCDGWGARSVTRVNRGGTPSTALGITVAVAMAFLLSGSFNRVIAITAFFFVAKYGISYGAVFALRRREPDTPRPYRSWGYPWTVLLAVGGSAAFLVGAFFGDERNSLYGVALLLASDPVYRLTKKFAR